jgi:GTP-binding protein
MRIIEAEFVASAGRPEEFPRQPWPEIAFAGRSNVGKSSLINRLVNRRKLAHTSSTPGRTRTVNFYVLNGKVLFTDLPGYGYAKVSRTVKEAWWDLVEGYLRGREQLRGVVHIVDARHPPTADDREMQEFLADVGLPSLVVLTKADKVDRGKRRASRTAAVEVLGLPDPEAPLLVSAETGEGISELWRALDERLAAPPVRPRAAADTTRKGPRF